MQAITRLEYEQECREMGFAPLPDEELVEFAIEFDLYDSEELEALEAASVSLKIQRGFSAEVEMNKLARSAQSKNGISVMGGQIWDHCPHCGMEPVYMPLLVCRDCWPVSAW